MLVRGVNETYMRHIVVIRLLCSCINELVNKMPYLIIVGVCLGFIGCTKVANLKVPRPLYPTIERVVITGDCICGEELQKVKNNMIKLEQLIDELWISPCLEGK